MILVYNQTTDFWFDKYTDCEMNYVYSSSSIYTKERTNWRIWIPSVLHKEEYSINRTFGLDTSYNVIIDPSYLSSIQLTLKWEQNCLMLIPINNFLYHNCSISSFIFA